MNDRDSIQTRCLRFCSCFFFWKTYIWFDCAFKNWSLICHSSWQPFTDILCSEINKNSAGSLSPEWKERHGNRLGQLPWENSLGVLAKMETKYFHTNGSKKSTDLLQKRLQSLNNFQNQVSNFQFYLLLKRG